jgi:hypothetical protein
VHGVHRGATLASWSDRRESEAEKAGHLLDHWFDPIETGLRDRVREFIQAMIEGEIGAALRPPPKGGFREC